VATDTTVVVRIGEGSGVGVPSALAVDYHFLVTVALPRLNAAIAEYQRLAAADSVLSVAQAERMAALERQIEDLTALVSTVRAQNVEYDKLQRASHRAFLRERRLRNGLIVALGGAVIVAIIR
jgi:hypothetical protein